MWATSVIFKMLTKVNNGRIWSPCWLLSCCHFQLKHIFPQARQSNWFRKSTNCVDVFFFFIVLTVFFFCTGNCAVDWWDFCGQIPTTDQGNKNQETVLTEVLVIYVFFLPKSDKNFNAFKDFSTPAIATVFQRKLVYMFFTCTFVNSRRRRDVLMYTAV
jgi:hypothetical protein